jgi:iron complex transport system ATP-binding protein
MQIAIDDLRVAYNGTRVVDGLSMDVSSGGWTCVIGPNGAGKTTLLRAIAGLTPFDGAIRVGSESVGEMQRRRLARLVAYVPQRPFVPLGATVVDYVLMGRTPYIPYFGVESESDLQVVGDVLSRLELEEFASRLLGSLSGGELQRAILARALAQQAPVLLLDEPTSALDIGHQQQVLELVDALRRDDDLTVLSTMHDLTLAGQFSDSVWMLDGGRVVAHGDAASVLDAQLIERHFGASVRVVAEGEGLLVIPTRKVEVER